MKSKLPPGSRAERIEFVRNLRRQHALERPRVRLARNRRRIAAAGLFLIVAATAGWLALLASNLVSGNKAIAAVYFGIAAQSFLFVVLVYSVGGLTAADRDLDERERALRDHMYALAYRILGIVVGGLSFIAVTANVIFNWHPAINPAIGVAPFLVTFIWFLGTLPFALIAWTVPDPEPDTQP